MKIIYHEQVVEYLNELVDVLYKQGYFGFKEFAYDYVDWILDRITEDIFIMPAKTAPEYFSKYGESLVYIRLKRNAQTTWYVFLVLLIKYIFVSLQKKCEDVIVKSPCEIISIPINTSVSFNFPNEYEMSEMHV